MPQDATNPIAASVRAELARAKISGRRLSNELSWHYPHLARRLSGDVAFRADEIGRIAAHLGVSLERLYGLPPDQTTPDVPAAQAS